MRGMRSLNGTSDSGWLFSGKRPRASMLEVDSGMPSTVQAISPLMDRLMLLIEGSQCVPGAEFDVELAFREALANAVIHGNKEDPETNVHIRSRCGPGNEISIVVADPGKEFDVGKTLGDGSPDRSPIPNMGTASA